MYSITEEVVKWLSGLGYSASTFPSASATPPFVTVERTGGGVTDLVDHPLMAVQAWAATEEDAEEIAVQIRNEALTGTVPYGVGKMDVNAGPYPFWDEDTRYPRYQIVFDVTCQLID